MLINLKKIVRITIIVVISLLVITSIFYFYPEGKLPVSSKVDKILVIKHSRQLQVFSNNKKLKTYTISLGFRPQGKKQFEGDGRTPEGVYFIRSKNNKSIAYKRFGISYPNKEDKVFASKNGRSAGGNIMIHGMMNGKGYWGKFHRFIDWTGGCIALTNNEMDDLFKHIDVGCEVEIIK